MFYLHARLLERAAKLSEELGGGRYGTADRRNASGKSERLYTHEPDPSITDGQIYLEPELFYQGQKPAVNVGMSVSRVGGETEAPVMKRLVETLRLEYRPVPRARGLHGSGAPRSHERNEAYDRARTAYPRHFGSAGIPGRFPGSSRWLRSCGRRRKLDQLPRGLVERFKGWISAWVTEHCPRAPSLGSRIRASFPRRTSRTSLRARCLPGRDCAEARGERLKW